MSQLSITSEFLLIIIVNSFDKVIRYVLFTSLRGPHRRHVSVSDLLVAKCVHVVFADHLPLRRLEHRRAPGRVLDADFVRLRHEVLDQIL